MSYPNNHIPPHCRQCDHDTMRFLMELPRLGAQPAIAVFQCDNCKTTTNRVLYSELQK